MLSALSVGGFFLEIEMMLCGNNLQKSQILYKHAAKESRPVGEGEAVGSVRRYSSRLSGPAAGRAPCDH